MGMKIPTRFSLASVFLLIALSAASFAWKSHEIRRQRARRALVEEIRTAGGHVWFERDESGNPSDQVSRLYLANTKLDDSILSRLWLLSDAPVVSFNSTSFSDAQVHYLDDFDRLRELKLNGTRISSSGIRHLSERHDLARITLYETEFEADDQAFLIELFPNAWEVGLPGVNSWLRR